MFSVILYMLRQTVDNRAPLLLFPYFSPLTVTFPKLAFTSRPLYPWTLWKILLSSVNGVEPGFDLCSLYQLLRISGVLLDRQCSLVNVLLFSKSWVFLFVPSNYRSVELDQVRPIYEK
jgi:hypothetical protein